MNLYYILIPCTVIDLYIPVPYIPYQPSTVPVIIYCGGWCLVRASCADFCVCSLRIGGATIPDDDDVFCTFAPANINTTPGRAAIYSLRRLYIVTVALYIILYMRYIPRNNTNTQYISITKVHQCY